jgi:hypothetical protein
MTMTAAERTRRAPWMRWMLLGCLGWIVLMVAVGTPIGILITPAAGPLLGWLVGGVTYLIIGLLTRR